ncbi:MAG: hypothetical protein JW917_03355 [Ignavibacteria bacterium]|nr:hypothetical protein [Ignavibacteria bacterium]
MEKHNEKYLKYLILLLEKDFLSHPGYKNQKVLFELLYRLKNSTNLIKDIYLLSKIKSFELISAYLIFVLKKSGEKQINFDNLVENINEDKKFLKKELVNHFLKISSEEIIGEPVTKEFDFQEEYPAVNNIYESENNIETLENELSEKKDIIDKNDESKIEIDKNKEMDYEKNKAVHFKEELELIQTKEELLKENIFGIPGSKDEINKPVEENIKNEEIKPEEVFDIPEKKLSDYPEVMETKKEKDNDLDLEKENKKITVKKIREFFHFKKHKVVKEKEQAFSEEENEKLVEINKTKIIMPLSEEEQKIRKILIEPPDEDYTDYNKTFDETDEIKKTENITVTEREENKIFSEYEKILREKNLIIAEGLNKIKEVKDKEKLIENEFKDVIENIIDECEYMENYSREMTFEVITNIYSTIKLSLRQVKEKNYKPDNELIELFINAIILIQKLVSGDDFSEYENTVAQIEMRQKELIKEKEKKERAEKIKKEKKEVEKKLDEKYSDSNERKKLLLLKSKILSVEDIFKSLETIKGEFQTYEAHRLLSKSFPDFKTIVKLSNELKIENMAQLSEASYIFIKYVQNYRIDPFGTDVKEIINYIIVNFKLLFLGKTSKDIEIFISYLNNPDKIFTEKNNNK